MGVKSFQRRHVLGKSSLLSGVVHSMEDWFKSQVERLQESMKVLTQEAVAESGVDEVHYPTLASRFGELMIQAETLAIHLKVVEMYAKKRPVDSIRSYLVDELSRCAILLSSSPSPMDRVRMEYKMKALGVALEVLRS